MGLQLEYSKMEKLTRAPFGTYADVQPNVIEGISLVHIDDLKPHEDYLKDRASKLESYVEDLPFMILPAIIVDSEYQVVIDGHHRLNLFRRYNMTIDILVNPPNSAHTVDKE